MGLHAVSIYAKHDSAFFLNLRIHIPETARLIGAAGAHVRRVKAEVNLFASVIRNGVYGSVMIYDPEEKSPVLLFRFQALLQILLVLFTFHSVISTILGMTSSANPALPG